MDPIDFDTLDCQNKRVLIRVDFNVPMDDNGNITDDTRIRAAIPTIELALSKGARVMLMSHLGRPKEGVYDEQYSLKAVADYLDTLISPKVRLEKEWLAGVEVAPNELVMCENVRFNLGEKENALKLSTQIAALCDVFVMDAFGSAHRAHASTHGVAKFAPVACAGPLLMREIHMLKKLLDNPRRPMVAIVGGSKVSSKLSVLHALSEKVDQLIVGGGIANTFLAATGCDVGASLYEPDLVEEAKHILASISHEGGFVPLPVDVKTAKTFDKDAEAELKLVNEIASDDQILDVGPQTAERLCELLRNAGTILWNGPVGVFEFDHFSGGTEAVARAVAGSAAYSAAGGGDTLAAISKYDLASHIDYISTGGGAFLECLEGKKLPAIDVLEIRAQAHEKN